MARYLNPWHKPHDNSYGPEFYSTEVTPTSYKGFSIYRRHEGCFDVVTDGANGPECKTQRAGINGARAFINEFWERENAA